jgi:DNA-binding CsgD family transcriptional regulator
VSPVNAARAGGEQGSVVSLDPRSGALRERGAIRGACRELPIFGLLFLMLAGVVCADLVADAMSGIGPLHLAVELVALAVALTGVGTAARKSYAAVRRAKELHGDLQRTQADVARWRGEAEALLHRMGTALDEHFARWALTDAEREIAIQILKGLSYKEVAAERGTTERTVRHQALAIFRKAGVGGRAEMAAFFLQVMLLPACAADQGDRTAEMPAPRPRAEA